MFRQGTEGPSIFFVDFLRLFKHLDPSLPSPHSGSAPTGSELVHEASDPGGPGSSWPATDTPTSERKHPCAPRETRTPARHAPPAGRPPPTGPARHGGTPSGPGAHRARRPPHRHRREPALRPGRPGRTPARGPAPTAARSTVLHRHGHGTGRARTPRPAAPRPVPRHPTGGAGTGHVRAIAHAGARTGGPRGPPGVRGACRMPHSRHRTGGGCRTGRSADPPPRTGRSPVRVNNGIPSEGGAPAAAFQDRVAVLSDLHSRAPQWQLAVLQPVRPDPVEDVPQSSGAALVDERQLPAVTGGPCPGAVRVREPRDPLVAVSPVPPPDRREWRTPRRRRARRRPPDPGTTKGRSAFADRPFVDQGE